MHSWDLKAQKADLEVTAVTSTVSPRGGHVDMWTSEVIAGGGFSGDLASPTEQGDHGRAK